MKKIILISLSILFHGLIAYGQKTDKYSYGDWFQLRNNWANVEDRPDLEIFESDSVYFKQTLFVNPCSFDFNGHIENNIIVYISKMRCLNLETREWTEYTNDTVLYKVIESEENYLKIVNLSNKEELIYRKRNQFSDFRKLLVSKGWSQNVHDAMSPKDMRLQSHSPNIPASDSTNCVWKFYDDNKLTIDYGSFESNFQWQVSSDSILRIYSENEMIDKYKIIKIRRFDINFLRIGERSCEINRNEIIGTYEDKVKKKGRIFRVKLRNDCSYEFYKTSTIGEFKVNYGYFEINDDRLILKPETYTYREDEPDGIYKSKSAVWKFADKQKIELKVNIDSDMLLLEYEDEMGEIYHLEKKR